MKIENQLEEYIFRFNQNLNGQRDFISLIEPFLNKIHSEAVAEKENFDAALELAKEISQETDPEKKEKLELKKKELVGNEVILYYVDHKDAKNSESKDKPEYIIAAPKESSFSFENLVSGPEKALEKKNLLFKNSLISVLSSVEWFFSQVLHFYYDKYPAAAGIKKKTLSLEELKSFDNVSDAEKYLIDQKIEETFRGGFENWMKLLKEEVKIKLKGINTFVSELVEIYQRRNLLVHNGGVVNSIYISKVDADLRESLKIGDELSVTPEYLNSAIEKLHIVFTLIAAELWKKLEPENEDRAGLIGHINFENMIAGRWKVAEELSSFMRDDDKLKSKSTSIGLLNHWLSKKRLGHFEDVKVEIAKADFSDKSNLYKLPLYSIIEDKESFFKTLPIALEHGDFEPDEILEFPIFEEMRATEEFDAFKLESEFFKTKIIEDD